MRVIVWGRDASRHRAQADGYEIAQSKASFFEQSDILSLHLRLNESTRSIVTLEDLSAMKPTSLFVNTSRAELLEIDAVIAALNRGRPGFAAIDIFESEPILQGHALLRLENCICTTHIGRVQLDSCERHFGAAFDNVVNFIEGTPTNIVNPGALQVRRQSHGETLKVGTARPKVKRSTQLLALRLIFPNSASTASTLNSITPTFRVGAVLWSLFNAAECVSDCDNTGTIGSCG